MKKTNLNLIKLWKSEVLELLLVTPFMNLDEEQENWLDLRWWCLRSKIVPEVRIYICLHFPFSGGQSSEEPLFALKGHFLKNLSDAEDETQFPIQFFSRISDFWKVKNMVLICKFVYIFWQVFHGKYRLFSKMELFLSRKFQMTSLHTFASFGAKTNAYQI